ncbi:hypothetical protein [Paracoccus sp. PAR01]|uniref:hypothetical protein n=1 Tax=Paracoccus sp. PAR01 TaxID=2769282 RepID=UPI00177EA939|nr:hypothetical protein [Paracoccus sp. PAR01]MBD9528879.1 hypothetical protein [Paracoccus sp. PAR01]
MIDERCCRDDARDDVNEPGFLHPLPRVPKKPANFDAEIKRLTDENTGFRMRLEAILSAEAEAARLRSKLSLLETQIETTLAADKENRTLLDRLSEQVAIYDERLAFAAFGAYPSRHPGSWRASAPCPSSRRSCDGA